MVSIMIVITLDGRFNFVFIVDRCLDYNTHTHTHESRNGNTQQSDYNSYKHAIKTEIPLVAISQKQFSNEI